MRIGRSLPKLQGRKNAPERRRGAAAQSGDFMRRIVFFAFLVLAVPGAAWGASSYQGLWLSTPYPDRTFAPGDEFSLDLTVQNFALPPQRVALSVSQVPEGWSTTFVAEGAPIAALEVAPDQSATFTLRAAAPERVESGTYRIEVRAEGEGGEADVLALTLSVGSVLPLELVLEPELPALRGAAGSDFTFRVSIKNGGGDDALVQLDSAAPPGFLVTFKESYGTKELTSMPVKPGESKKVEVKVEVPNEVPAGVYPVLMRTTSGEAEAETQLVLDVTGKPQLRLSSPDGRLSGDAEAGEATAIALVLSNTGTAPAREIKFASSEPAGWTVAFEPETLEGVAPGEPQEVKAIITPPEKAIAGDYGVTLRANGKDASASSEFRVTVRTSTMWGVIGVAVIAAALLILVLAVVRYGRR